MKGLLIKDLKLIKTCGLFPMLALAVFVILQLGAGNGEMGVGLTILILSIFSITSITYDEYDNGMPFLLTLPITRKKYVQEKYVLGFGLITVAWVTMSVICFAYEYFTQANFVNAFSQKLVVTVTYLFAVYFMIAFEIAMKLKFAERSGLATILIMAVMGTLAVLLQVTFDFSLEMVIAEYLGVELLIAAAVVFAAVIYGLYWWSVRIMERREL